MRKIGFKWRRNHLRKPLKRCVTPPPAFYNVSLVPPHDSFPTGRFITSFVTALSAANFIHRVLNSSNPTRPAFNIERLLYSRSGESLSRVNAVASGSEETQINSFILYKLTSECDTVDVIYIPNIFTTTLRERTLKVQSGVIQSGYYGVNIKPPRSFIHH